jgi:PII-like signaling protein
VIEIVDIEERIRAFLPTCDAMIGEGLITLERVEVLKYSAGGGAAATGGSES